MAYEEAPEGWILDEPEEPERSLYGPKDVDLPGQAAYPRPQMVLGDPKDVPGLIGVGTINLNELRGAHQGVGRPIVVGEEGEFAVVPKGSSGDYFGVFKDAASAEDYAKKIEEREKVTNDALATRQYPTEYSHQVPLTGYAKDLREQQIAGTAQPLRPDQQIHGPMGEAPQPMTRKQQALNRVANLAPLVGEEEDEEEQLPPEAWGTEDQGGGGGGGPASSAGDGPPPGWEPAGSLPRGVLTGAFKGHESTFETAASKYDVDPDLLMGIAEFETGHGKSDMVKYRNNPGGLYDSEAGDYMRFSSLDKGIDAMASNLRRTYLDKGLTTIPAIAEEYAPVNAPNDPNHTNAEWPGSVASEYKRLQKLRGSSPGPESEMGVPPPGWEEIQVDKNVGTLEQDAQPLAMDFLTKAQEWAKDRGLEVRVTEGYRTPERQAELYAQGRTAPGPIVTNAKPGQSNHQSARAFDVGIFKNGKEIEEKKLWNELGQIGKDSGLSWGGDFKSIYDPNHFELLRDRPTERPRAKTGTDFQAEEAPPGWVPLEPATQGPVELRKGVEDQELVEVRRAEPAQTQAAPAADTSMGEPRSTDYAPGIGPIPTAGSAAEYHPGMGADVRGGDVVYDKGGPRRPVPPEPPGQTYKWTERPGTREPGAPTIRRRVEELPMVTEKMATDLGLTDWRDLDAGGRVVRRAEFAGKGTGVSKADYEARQKALAEPGAEVGATEALAKRAERYPEQLPEATTEGLVKSEAPYANLVPSGVRKFIQGKVIEPAEKWLLQHGPGTGFATEAAQRVAKEGPGGVIKAAKGARTGELAAGEALQDYTENRYSRMQDPIAFAKADIPRLHAELDAQRVKTASMRNRGYVPESTETTYRYGIGDQQSKVKQSIYQEEMKKEAELIRTLRQAEDAAEGRLGQETFSDKLLNAAGDQMVKEGKRSLPDINKKLEAWNQRWAPYIDKKWDSDEGIQFVESASQNAGPILSNLVNPLFGGLMMYGQNVEANEQEITEKLKKAGKPIDEKEVRKEASLRAVDQTVMEYPGQIFMTKFLGKTLRRIPANLAKQTPAVQGQWAREAAEEILPELLQETLVTTPTQDLISRQRNEAMGISKPLTHEEAAKTTLASMGQAALQTLGLGAAGAVTTKVSEAAGEARAQRMADKLAQQKGPTFAERQAQEKATLKSGTYRNFADIPAEPTAVEKPGAPPTIPAEALAAEQTIPATPGATAPEAAAAPEPTIPATKPAATATASTTAPPTNARDYLLSQGHTAAQIDAMSTSAMHKLLNAAPSLPPGLKVLAVNSNTGEIHYSGGIGTTPVLPAAGMTVNNAFSPGGRQSGTITAVNPDGTLMVSWEGKAPIKVKGGSGLRLPPGATAAATTSAGTTAGAAAATAATKPAATIPATPQTPPGTPKETKALEEEGPTTEADLEALKQKYQAEIAGKPSQPIGTSTASVLSFEDDRAPAPERAAQISSLQSVLATHPRSGGKPVELIPVTRTMGGTKRQQALNRTIDGLEKALGKNIQFVRSGTAEALPFTGIVHPSHPNTIFLDAAGDRNVLALVGHEWGHTLKTTNPELHGQMVEQMKPLVKEWAKQEGKLKGEEGYPQEEVSDEVASNTIGDAFTRPDFWKKLNKKNPSLFKQAVKSVHEFFKNLIKKARGSEWGTEEFISDLESMHKVIADAVNQAVTKGPEPTLKEAMGEGPKFAPRETKEAKPHVVRSDTREKSVKGAEFLEQTTRPGHSYRGMTKAEYDNTVGKGSGIGSTGVYSFAQEGTSFGEDAKTAESYINYGRDDPRKTDKPTYLVEVSNEGLEKNRQGYFYANKPVPQSQITRVWEMTGEGDSIVARDIPITKPVELKAAMEGEKAEKLKEREKGVSEGQPLFATRKKKERAEPEAALRREAEEISHEEDRAMGASAKAAAKSVADRPHIRKIIQWPVARSIRLGREKGGMNWRGFGSKDITRFYNGVKHVLLNTKGFEYLGQAVMKYVDRAAAYRGKYGTMAERALASAGRNQKTAREEYWDFWQTDQIKGSAAADKFYETMSPGAKKMVDAAIRGYDEMGSISEKGGVKIRDAGTKTWSTFKKYSSPFRRYHPHVLQKDIQQVLAKPTADPAAWNRLKDIMVSKGLISKTNPEASLQEFVKNYNAVGKPNGFFGSLEKRRTVDFPSELFDYSYGTFVNYINQWSDRMAQVEAFGQGVEGESNLLNQAIDEAADDNTANYLKNVRASIYGDAITNPIARITATANNIATASQLGRPGFGVKNFILGQGMNVAKLGPIKYLRSLPGMVAEIPDGFERGNLTHDFMNIMHDGEEAGAGKTSRQLAGAAMKFSGGTAAEHWNRGVAMRGARITLRQAINAHTKNRTSRTTARYLGHFKRLGFFGTQAQDLILEGGKGELFDRYMRASVNQIHGGYTFADVPVLMESPVGRALFKYQKIGSELLSYFAKEVVSPAVRAATRGTLNLQQESVDIINEDGTKGTVRVPGAYLPLAYFVGAMAAAGAGVEWWQENFMGIPQRTATLAQIMSTWDENKMKAAGLIWQKAYMYLLQGGSFGTLGNLMQTGFDWNDKRSFKDPTHPPALSVPISILAAAQDFWDQKDWSPEHVAHSLDQLLEDTVGFYREGKNMAAQANDAWGISDFKPLLVRAREQDMGWIRALTRRYEQDVGTKEKTRTPGRMGSGPTSSYKDRLWEELMLGDTDAAQTRIDQYLALFPDDKQSQKQAFDGLKASMADKQPVKAGAGGEDMRQNFLNWAEDHLHHTFYGIELDKSSLARIERIDSTYRDTAQSVGLLEPKKTTPKSLQEAMARNAPIHQ